MARKTFGSTCALTASLSLCQFFCPLVVCFAVSCCCDRMLYNHRIIAASYVEVALYCMSAQAVLLLLLHLGTRLRHVLHGCFQIVHLPLQLRQLLIQTSESNAGGTV